LTLNPSFSSIGFIEPDCIVFLMHFLSHSSILATQNRL
jgi:hypothetical protein